MVEGAFKGCDSLIVDDLNYTDIDSRVAISCKTVRAHEETFVLHLHRTCITAVIISRVAIQSIERKLTGVSPIPSVDLSVCVPRKYTVAKRLIGSGCRLGW